MTVARAAAAGALALAVALAVWLLLLKGDGGTRVHAAVPDRRPAGAGRRRPGRRPPRRLRAGDRAHRGNRAAIKISVQEPYAPLREGTKAVIRLTSLSGVANRYVALTPAPGDAKELPDGATLTSESTTDVVDLDQIFNTLDESTREDLADVIKGFAAQYEGKGEEAGLSAKYFNPLLSSSRRLVQQVTEDEGGADALPRQLLAGGDRDRRAPRRLVRAVANANATASAIGQENAALARALGLLPTTLRRANTTFVNLRATLDDLDVLVAASKPATKDLAPFLRELRPLVAAARPTIHDLRTLGAPQRPGQRPRRGDAEVPEAAAAWRRRPSATAARRSRSCSRCSSSRGPTRPTSSAGSATSARALPTTTPTATSPASSRSSTPSSSPTTRPAACSRRSPTRPGSTAWRPASIRRCPGAASQPPADGSAPFTDGGGLDCDPSLTPPGP